MKGLWQILWTPIRKRLIAAVQSMMIAMQKTWRRREACGSSNRLIQNNYA